MTATNRPPTHLHRTMARERTPRERLATAQACSLHSRAAPVSLPPVPWDREAAQVETAASHPTRQQTALDHAADQILCDVVRAAMAGAEE